MTSALPFLLLCSLPVQGFSYARDREENRLSEERLHAGRGKRSDGWAYDSIYRLVGQKRDIHARTGEPRETRSWALDGAGNWQTLTIDPRRGPTKTLSQDADRLNSYSSFAGTAQRDDASGNRLDDGRFLYSWDFLHRLREVRDRSTGEMVSRSSYDAFSAQGHLMGSGRRVGKRVARDKAAKREASDTRFFYEGTTCIEEREGGAVRQYVWGPSLGTPLAMERYGRNGRLESRRFFHEDAKGWTAALSDERGRITERITYDAFGEPRFEGADGEPLEDQSRSPSGNPWLYGGGRFEPDTRLHLMQHRFYSAEQGRWISRDPVGVWGDPWGMGNPYVYVGGNAVNGWDEEGLEEESETRFFKTMEFINRWGRFESIRRGENLVLRRFLAPVEADIRSNEPPSWWKLGYASFVRAVQEAQAGNQGRAWFYTVMAAADLNLLAAVGKTVSKYSVYEVGERIMPTSIWSPLSTLPPAARGAEYISRYGRMGSAALSAWTWLSEPLTATKLFLRSGGTPSALASLRGIGSSTVAPAGMHLLDMLVTNSCSPLSSTGAGGGGEGLWRGRGLSGSAAAD